MLPMTESSTNSSLPTLMGTGWRCCAQTPDSITDPAQLEDVSADWLPAVIPGTVASALRAHGRWSFDRPVDMDAFDWWFRTTFSADSRHLTLDSRLAFLCFDGLATLAEVWLNGQSILTTDNMFRGYRVDVSGKLQSENELTIVFRSLLHNLKRKRPRPRWKTNLVQHQQLRWLRTSLLGRIPGWSPPVPAIGPWRAIRLETEPVQLWDRHLTARLEGTTGIVRLQARVSASVPLVDARLRVGNHVMPLHVSKDECGAKISGELTINQVPLWWPHTHGSPRLLKSVFSITTAEGDVDFTCPDVGFRKLEVDTSDQGFGLRVNDVPVFCRGACWTVSDIFTHAGSAESLEQELRLARDAGVNMLRVGGTMTCESEEFYRLCDQLGILVWQDFPFANMDYPVQDEAFRQNIEQEAVEQLRRLASHPCLAVYCGNSEIEQQAAMLGLPRELWSNAWFSTELPALCAAHHPGTVYVPSSPTGGALPFQPDTGLTHYYGVGAYLRTIDDVRRSDVRFTPECLGFSNVPDSTAIEALTNGSPPAAHSPLWKQRVPRDTGAGWDFEDVRDHYVRELFDTDPVALRSRNMPRYLQLGRVATGEMMSQVFSEWRSCHSRTRGALVWFYKDLWPGAGWGILDSAGLPKAAYYALKRTWNSRQLTVTDEGLNGLHLHLTNETDAECTGFVEVQLLREPATVIAREEVAVKVSSRSRQMLTADEILGRFTDVSYAYRFGPPQHDVALITWFDERRQPVCEAFHWISRRDPVPMRNVVVDSSAHPNCDGTYRVQLRSDSFLHSVQLQARGYLPSDNFFHLGPNRTKEVLFRPFGAAPAAFQAELEALNLHETQPISQSERTL